MIINPDSVKGKEIIDFLKKELGLPDKMTEFTLRVKMDQPFTVNCEYYPEEKCNHDWMATNIFIIEKSEDDKRCLYICTKCGEHKHGM